MPDTNIQITIGLAILVTLFFLYPFLKDHKDAKERRATEQTIGAKVRAYLSRYYARLRSRR